MSDEQWLRDTLRRSVPEPAAGDRLGGVRERRRRTTRRHQVLAGAGAALVVVLALLAPVALHDRNDGPAPADVRRTDPRYDGPGCPTTEDPWLDGPDAVPTGAVSVRLCAGSPAPFQAPADALVTDPDRLVGTVNDQPVGGTDGICTTDTGTSYQLVFAYPDGSTVVVHGELFGCDTLLVGHTDRDRGAQEPWNTFRTLLRQQRAASRAPAAVPTPTCGTATTPASTSPIAAPTEMTKAVFCPDEGAPVSIDAADLATILASYEREQPDGGIYDCTSRSRWRIVGVTAWGDVVDLRGDCARFDADDSPGYDFGRDARLVFERLRRQA